VKRAVALIALGTTLVLAGAGCGKSTSVVGHIPAGDHLLLDGAGRTRTKGGFYVWRPGSPAKPTAAPRGWSNYPRWSPDGRSIAYERIGSAYWIYLLRPDGTNVREPGHACCAWAPSWSPEGRYFVFNTLDEFVIVNASTGHERTLPGSFTWVGGPVWGKRGIAYVDSHSDIELLNPRTGRSKLVARGYLHTRLAWSPSGVLAALKPTRIVVLSAAGRVLAELPTPAGTKIQCAVWSPNGQQILMTSTTASGANDSLWLGTLSTKQWQRLWVPMPRGAFHGCVDGWR
jgi:Tol biopolymer transport system component